MSKQRSACERNLNLRTRATTPLPTERLPKEESVAQRLLQVGAKRAAQPSRNLATQHAVVLQIGTRPLSKVHQAPPFRPV